MSEYKRYCLTLTVADPSARDRFRALSRPESFFEIRPNRSPGERGAYSVEMTQSEYEAALEDAENPDSNLIAVEPTQRAKRHSSGSVTPGIVAMEYLAAQEGDSLGLTGSGVDVGVIDSGLSGELRDSVFSGRIKSAKAFGSVVFEDGSSRPAAPYDDTDGHGSAMMGIAVPPGAQLVIGAYGDTLDDIAAALYWMVDEVGVDIVNISSGFPDSETVMSDAVAHARSNNVIIFASAGNSGIVNDSSVGLEVIEYPANYLGVNAISNYRPSTDSLSFTSNYGPKIWAASPGSEVYVYDQGGDAVYKDDEGTSGASAAATRMAAMLMTGGRSPGNVVIYLADNARKTGASPLNEGAGVLQLAAAEQQLQQDKPEQIDLNGDPITSPGVSGSTQDGTGNPDSGACG